MEPPPDDGDGVVDRGRDGDGDSVPGPGALNGTRWWRLVVATRVAAAAAVVVVVVVGSLARWAWALDDWG